MGTADTMALAILWLNLKAILVALSDFPHRSTHAKRVPKETLNGK